MMWSSARESMLPLCHSHFILSLPTTTMKRAALQLLALSSTTSAFVGTGGNSRFVASPLNTATSTIYEADPVQATKPTGTSFLPEETVERAKAGNKIEKVKMAKDPTSAFVDVYEYARKIREGEMTWEEVEAADLDTVSCLYFVLDCTMAIIEGLIETSALQPALGSYEHVYSSLWFISSLRLHPAAFQLK